MEDNYELLLSYALNSDNYKRWRNEHAKMFGSTFSAAFSESTEAQIHLTAALIDITKRSFNSALKKLLMLDSFCISDFDRAALDYFLGLCYELLGDEEVMSEYYERLRASGMITAFPTALHPYYRTAKFAQRDAECAKSMYYYRRALAFYKELPDNASARLSAGQIVYDIATVLLFMHRYEECKIFLELSQQYDPAPNSQRDYVAAILCAAEGRRNDCMSYLASMDKAFAESCKHVVSAIFSGTDPHYCIVQQSRAGYAALWAKLAEQKDEIEKLMRSGITAAERLISDAFTQALPFMKKRIECRAAFVNGSITVFCKNYCVKTLKNEYAALFSQKPQELESWTFVSVEYFERNDDMSIFDIFKKRKESVSSNPLAAAIKKLERNQITIIPDENAKVSDPSASKIGGKPYLPADFEWPTYTCSDDDVTRPLSFFCQIKLSEVKPYDKNGLLPDRGTLYFFYECESMRWGFDPLDKGAARVYWYDTADCMNFAPLNIPADIDEEYVIPEMPLHFCAKSSYPSFDELEVLDPKVDCDWDEYDEVIASLGIDTDEDVEEHKLLGYANAIQNEMLTEAERISRGLYCGDPESYRETPDDVAEDIADHAADWILLLQISTISKDDYELMLGDCGMLYFYIRKQDLAAGRFDRVHFSVQCG